MTIQLFFIISTVIAWLGMFGFAYESIVGRMTRRTRWSDMTRYQWTLCWMMVQFFPCLLITLLVHAFRGAA